MTPNQAIGYNLITKALDRGGNFFDTLTFLLIGELFTLFQLVIVYVHAYLSKVSKNFEDIIWMQENSLWKLWVPSRTILGEKSSRRRFYKINVRTDP